MGAVTSILAFVVTGVSASVSWCFCSAVTSIFGACCGNDKPSTVPASVTSGRKRSVALLLLCVVMSLVFQYAVTPAIIDAPSAVSFLKNPWLDGCQNLQDDTFLRICVGNNAVYRPSFAATVMFLMFAVASYCKPTFNREVWPAKFILFFFFVVGMLFVPNKPLFNPIYLNVGRIAGSIFILIQQIIIVDVAYNWNDSWVEKSNKAELEQVGGGKKWLLAIVASCALLFAAALAGLIYMFVVFTGCASNNAFISVTLIFCLLITVAQLTGEEGSLLSSAFVSAWAVYLLYSAVTKNPNTTCNPMLGQGTPSNIVLGLLFTFLSLGWTGWSYTAEDKLKPNDATTTAPEAANNNSNNAGKDQYGSTEERKVAGVVTGTDEVEVQDEQGGADGQVEQVDNTDSTPVSISWKINVILAVVSGWQAMILSQWGSIADGGDVANPGVGNVAMWMVIGPQWIVLALYLWTLTAPRMFPDREFN